MNVMKRAWVIARDGVKKFGGKVTEYFAEALRIAWREYKEYSSRFEFELKGDTRKTRTWIAAIVGRHPKFVLDRRFLSPDHFDRYDDKIFYLYPGYYEVYNGKRRMFVKIENGECRVVEKEEVLVRFAS